MPQQKPQDNSNSAGWGILGPAVGAMGLAFRTDNFKDSFIDKMNRADYISDRPEFSQVDPRLTKGFIDYGEAGLRSQAGDVWKDTLASKYSPWERADISGAGNYRTALTDAQLKNITTVTPDASSARFGGTDVAPVGGGISETLWGNPKHPRYSYASGNKSGPGIVIGNINGIGDRNPSAHFSGVNLPQSEKTDYLYTGGSQEVDTSNRGWGVSTYKNSGADFDAGSDVHFGREHRQIAGLTTANDLYTYISDQGFQPPKPKSNPGEYLQELTETVKKITGDTRSDNEVLIDRASLQPTSGPTTRNTGKLPKQSELDWKGTTVKATRKAGDASFFQRLNLTEQQNFNPFDRSWVQAPLDTNVEMKIDPEVKRAGAPGYTPTKGVNVGRQLARRFAPGAVATSIVSPEVATDIRKGDYLAATGKSAAAFGTGELISGAGNFVLNQVARVAPSAPAAVNALSTIATPAALSIGLIDTASTLATGKNVRQLAVDSGNFGPAIQAMSMPRTMAPLGGAGSVSDSVGMQATVPNLSPKRKEESEALQKKVIEARKRGGRWKIGGFALPDFGFSEGLGIN